MAEEIWRDSPSCPRLQVSNLGRVMTKVHYKPMPHGGLRKYGGFPYDGVWSKRDKRMIIGVRGKTYKVARLVAEAFLGPPPFPRAVVMHLDENSRNNNVENLQWGTQKENLNAPGFLEYCRGRTGENNPCIKGRAKKLQQG